MHDIDRTQLDFQQQPGAFQPGHFQSHQSGRGALSEQEEVEFAHELLCVATSRSLSSSSVTSSTRQAAP